MSRTYRCNKQKDSYLIVSNRVLSEWVNFGHENSLCINRDPTSKESIKRIARFHSDARHFFYQYKGPGWFYNIMQRQYRTLVKTELSNFYKDADYEIQLLRKPYREYWT